MEERNEQEIHQGVVTLPYFDEQIPALFLQDGARYIPVIALCHLLGLRAEREIPRWRRLILWRNARKLPFCTATRGKRLVWCLHLGALPLWCHCFDWSKVSPERQEQLRQATGAWNKQVEQVHQHMLSSYQQLRCMLFDVLTIYADADSILSRYEFLLDGFDDRSELEILLHQGRKLIAEVTALARGLIQEQAAMPTVDAVQLDTDGQEVGTFSLPLFPIVSSEARAQFFSHLKLLTQWHRDIATALRAHSHWKAEDNER
jgi:hypothetical protein